MCLDTKIYSFYALLVQSFFILAAIPAKNSFLYTYISFETSIFIKNRMHLKRVFRFLVVMV